MEVHDLNKFHPGYHAVSYVWGQPDPSEAYILSIDGNMVAVRQNIWRFLDQMRKERFNEQLWVDALCINQSDLAERSQQVALMGRIYAKANRVHVWLGDDDKHVQLAMHNIATKDWGAVRQTVPRDERTPLDEDLATIFPFWKCQYWSRLWVVPEFVLANRLTIRCGSRMLMGELLEDFVESTGETSVLKDSGWVASTMVPIRIGIDIVKGRLNWLGRHNDWNIFDTGGFVNMMSVLGKGNCADDHDRIYAFLPFDKDVSSKVKPDYTKTISQVFVEVCDAIIQGYIHDPHSQRGKNMVLKFREIAEMLKLEPGCEEVDTALRKLTSIVKPPRITTHTGDTEDHLDALIIDRPPTPTKTYWPSEYLDHTIEIPREWHIPSGEVSDEKFHRKLARKSPDKTMVTQDKLVSDRAWDPGAELARFRRAILYKVPMGSEQVDDKWADVFDRGALLDGEDMRYMI